MAYDHERDLPPGYKTVDVRDSLTKPYQLSYAHDLAHRSNWLNRVGHRAVARIVNDVYGRDDAEAANMGCKIYEVLTAPSLVGDDFNNTPNYLDTDGTLLANELSFNLEAYGGLDFVPFADYARREMEKHAGVLCELTEDIVVTLRKNSGDRYRLMARTGAALLRNLHIEAECRIDNEAFGATE